MPSKFECESCKNSEGNGNKIEMISVMVDADSTLTGCVACEILAAFQLFIESSLPSASQALLKNLAQVSPNRKAAKLNPQQILSPIS